MCAGRVQYHFLVVVAGRQRQSDSEGRLAGPCAGWLLDGQIDSERHHKRATEPLRRIGALLKRANNVRRPEAEADQRLLVEWRLMPEVSVDFDDGPLSRELARR